MHIEFFNDPVRDLISIINAIEQEKKQKTDDINRVYLKIFPNTLELANTSDIDKVYREKYQKIIKSHVKSADTFVQLAVKAPYLANILISQDDFINEKSHICSLFDTTKVLELLKSTKSLVLIDEFFKRLNPTIAKNIFKSADVLIEIATTSAESLGYCLNIFLIPSYHKEIAESFKAFSQFIGLANQAKNRERYLEFALSQLIQKESNYLFKLMDGYNDFKSLVKNNFSVALSLAKTQPKLVAGLIADDEVKIESLINIILEEDPLDVFKINNVKRLFYYLGTELLAKAEARLSDFRAPKMLGSGLT